MKHLWLLITITMLLLGVNKQLDLQALLIQVVRDQRTNGWYDDRRRYQVDFIVVMSGAAALFAIGLSLRLRRVLPRVIVAVAGLGMLVLFVLVRASSFHYVDRALSLGATITVNSIVECSGIGLIITPPFSGRSPNEAGCQTTPPQILWKLSRSSRQCSVAPISIALGSSSCQGRDDRRHIRLAGTTMTRRQGSAWRRLDRKKESTRSTSSSAPEPRGEHRVSRPQRARKRSSVLSPDRHRSEHVGRHRRGVGSDCFVRRSLDVHPRRRGRPFPAYNTGIRSTSADVLAFTDDDCLVPTNWISSIAAAFRAEPAGDLLYGQVVPLDADEALTPLLRIEKPETLSRSTGYRVFGMGANFAARRRLFTSIGGFDEVLGGGGPLSSSQDYDLAYRTYKSGSSILLRPEVTLRHDGRREEGDWPALLRNYGTGDGGFYTKHVRCLDPYAAWLFAKVLTKSAAQSVIKPLVLRDSANVPYFRGLLAGARGSFRFKVDRARRLYVQPATTP